MGVSEVVGAGKIGLGGGKVKRRKAIKARRRDLHRKR